MIELTLWVHRRLLTPPILSIDDKTAMMGNRMKDIDQALQKARTAWFEIMAAYKNNQFDYDYIELPATPTLPERYLENCRLLQNREAILYRMRVRSITAEVGVLTGRFSKSILDICQPSKLHLIDTQLHRFAVHEKFKAEIDTGVIHLHEGDSSSIIAEFPDGYFDFIYIDADHSYQGVKRDIQAAKSKVKERGFLIFNDYTYWSPVECLRYGVMQAVNELCLEEDWEIIYFALEPYMYCDVALRRR
jgi:predicted O-methyltransferase YrrM